MAIIVTNPTIDSLHLAKRISEFSAKYAAGGQLGIVVNKVNKENMNNIYEQLKDSETDIIGTIPFDDALKEGKLDRNSEVVSEAVNQFYFRLNLPQENK